VTATTARAQVSDELGIERFRSAVDRSGLANVEWAAVPAHLHWDAGLLVGFAHAPLVVYDRDGNERDALVEQRLSSTLVGAIGLHDRFQLAASADIVGYQSGADGSASPTMKSLPAAGLGDLRLLGKAQLAGDAQYQATLIATLTVPAGSGRGFLREASVTFAPALAVSMTHDRVRGGLNVGYLFRKDVDTAGLTSADEGFARAAFAIKVGEMNAPIAELFTALSASSPLADVQRNQVALEMFAGATRRISWTMDAFVGGGIGLDNGFGTPAWRALIGVRFGSAAVVAPAPVVSRPTPLVLDPDRDGDGVFDATDLCPDEKELINNFRDGDGCPELPAQLAGQVLDPTGRPIAGANVVVVEVETATSKGLVTDEDGRFSHELNGGAITVTATAAEYEPGTSQLQIEPGTSGATTVTLVRKVRQGQLRGQVLSFNGKPLAATITVRGKTSMTVTSDADGNFRVELPEGAFQVEIAAAGYRTQKRNVNVKLDGVTVLNVDLRGSK
jgi:hypothetical protein